MAVLDGFRALAVTWVAAYHYLYFWTPAGPGTDLTAYGDAYAGVPFASLGFLGVHLFFMVSGFVILLTLERTASLSAFLVNRMIRLWPPLLLLGTVTFVAGHAFGPAEFRATWPEYLLSLAFLPPQYLGKLLGEAGWGWLDGAYWSLWVEVKFYLLMGFAFYFARARLIALWTLFELAAMAVGLCAQATDSGALTMLSGFLFQRYLPYFSFGLAGYLAFTGRFGPGAGRLVLVASIHVAAVTVADIAGPMGESLWRAAQYAVGQLALFALFYAFAWRRAKLAALAHPLLTGPGRASYGIYLLHQNLGLIALGLGWAATDRLGPLAPALVFAAVVAAALLSYRWLELPVQAALKRLAERLARPSRVLQQAQEEGSPSLADLTEPMSLALTARQDPVADRPGIHQPTSS